MNSLDVPIAQVARAGKSYPAADSKRITVGETESLMTVSEVAEYLRVSAAWVRQHAGGLRQPVVPSVKMGKAVRFRREAVVEFVRAMERTERTI